MGNNWLPYYYIRTCGRTFFLVLALSFASRNKMQAQTDPSRQQPDLSNVQPVSKPGNNDQVGETHSIFFPRRTACKSFLIDSISLPNSQIIQAQAGRPFQTSLKPVTRPAFLQMHGNIEYDYDYRSRLDTPFSAANLQQHREITYADATIKGKYPFRIIVSSRQSNTPFLKNYTDVSVQFKHEAFERSIKESMIAAMVGKFNLTDSLNRYERRLQQRQFVYDSLRNWLSDPARTQEIVQEKEGIYHQVALLGQLPRNPSNSTSIDAKIDSLLKQMQKPGDKEHQFDSKQRMLDSLFRQMQTLRHESDSLTAARKNDINDYSRKVMDARSIGELEELEKSANTHTISPGDKKLLALTQFSVGRSMLNYSDLTVNNISLSGLNVEYNPSWYAAFAVGSVDYLFRDFAFQNVGMPKQNLVVGRFGWGNRENRSYIFTIYSGTRNDLNGFAAPNASGTPTANTVHVLGYSLEARYKLDHNKSISFEAAKSSTPYWSDSQKSGAFNSAFTFGEHSNEAFSTRFNMNIPGIHSSFEAFYKLIGANFQSYSVFSNGNRQEGWGAKWRENLFRNQLSICIQVRKTVFDDPLMSASYQSSMIFKSIQLVYRKPKWPVLSAGYTPTSQLIKGPDGSLSTSVYYALNASAYYAYSYHHLRMNSSVLYSRFFNKGTDSGFVLYNASSVTYTHQIDWHILQLQTDVQYNEQPGLTYWMFQQGVNMNIGRFVTIGGSAKRDLLVAGSGYWGGGLQASVKISKLGSVRAQYSKDYLPDGVGGLLPYNWGRINFIRIF